MTFTRLFAFALAVAPEELDALAEAAIRSEPLAVEDERTTTE